MARRNIVLKSVDSPDKSRCVDLFLRPDGRFGFEEYRRDFEDNRGWYPIGFFGDRAFHSEEGALQDALSRIPWLKGALTND